MRHIALAITIALAGCIPRTSAGLLRDVCVRESTDLPTYAVTNTAAPYCVTVNPTMMARLDDAARVGVLAHEVGHVVDLRMGWPATELSADRYAGCVLGASGLPLAPTVALIAGGPTGPTHPPKRERIAAMAQAYAACSEHSK